MEIQEPELRYEVVSTTGWEITSGTAKPASSQPSTSYTVVDNCYGRITAMFLPGHGKQSETCRKQAEAFCAAKNADEERWLAETWHGTLSGYKNRRCRCPECTRANAVHQLPYQRRYRAGLTTRG